MTDIFICYSHQDEIWKCRFSLQLGVLANEQLLEYWDDRQIKPGVDWFSAISERIGNARVAVVLVSQHSLNSNFILKEEITRLLTRNTDSDFRLIPLIVRHCPWQHVGWISQIQVHPNDGVPLNSMEEHAWENALCELAIIIHEYLLSINNRGISSDSPSNNLVNQSTCKSDLEGLSWHFVQLRGRWQALLSSTDPIQRGRDFDYWLHDLFSALGLQTHGSFRRREELIDGVIFHDDHTYLIEAKWDEANNQSRDVDSLGGQILRSGKRCSGLFFSHAVFTSNAKQVANEWRCSCDIHLIEAPHLEALLLGKIDGANWLATLRCLAKRTGKRSIHIADILKAATSSNKPSIIETSIRRVSLAHLPSTGNALFGREYELAALDNAWRDPMTRILSLVAWGGVGKTALVNHWLDGMADREWDGAARVYGWSFYSQGTGEGRQASADTFFNESLAWFGDPDPSAGSPWDKGERLAQLVAAQPTLLVLDGLEPLQHPHGEIAGELKDPGIKVMLKELTRTGKGLCLICSRLPLSDLSHLEIGAAPSLVLGHLSPEAGALLLSHLGVVGSEVELVHAAEEYGYHPLALNLLGRYLKAACNGDVRQRDKVPALMDEPGLGGHTRRVMRHHEELLADTAATGILQLLSLFDRPAEVEAVAALRAEPPIIGLTDRLNELDELDWCLKLDQLRELGLLGNVRKDGALDCHRLVREFFAAALKEEAAEAFREGHDRLYEYYRGVPDKAQPDTLAEMEPLFRAVYHGCSAGRHQHVLDEVYWPRILRKGEAYVNKKLGAFGINLAAMAGFFADPWREPVAGLTPVHRAMVLNWAGFSLRALGRLHEAAQAMLSGMEQYEEQKEWDYAARSASNLSELYLTLGRIEEAVDTGRRAFVFADQCEDLFQKMTVCTTAAEALLQAGEKEESAELFSRAEAIQQERQPEYPLLYSLQGYRYCDLLLSQRQAKQAFARASQTLEWVTKGGLGLLSVTLDHLTLGRAAWQLGRAEEASQHLERAVTGLRQAGVVEFIAGGILARAAYRRQTGDAPGAARDLAEAHEIAQRGDMGLYLVDIALEAAQQTHDPTECQTHLKEAAQRIEKTGYKRRLPLLQALQNNQTPPVGSGLL